MFFNKIQNDVPLLHKISRGRPSAKIVLFYIPGFRDHLSTRTKLLSQFSEDVCGVYGTNLPNHGTNHVKRGLITPGIACDYVQALAKLLQGQFYKRVMTNKKTLVLMGHSTGVSFLIEAVRLLPQEMQEQCGIVGISPAFFVDHNVHPLIRLTAPLLRFYPYRFPVGFDVDDITDSNRMQLYILRDPNVDRGAAYAQTLYTIHKLSVQSWRNVQSNEFLPMRFLHGDDDRVARYPPYDTCNQTLIKSHIMKGRHDVTLQSDMRYTFYALEILRRYMREIDDYVKHRRSMQHGAYNRIVQQIIPFAT